MPTYEYRCNACEREFEYQQRMADPDLVKCEACGEDKLEKLISWVSFGSTGAQDIAALNSPNPELSFKVDRHRRPAEKKKEPVTTPEPATAAEPAPTAPATASTAPAPVEEEDLPADDPAKT